MDPQYERQQVYDSQEIDLDCVKISEAIQELTSYMEQGYERIDVETYESYGSTYHKISVTRKRMESDEEYERRMNQIKASHRREREQYEKLKAKFEPHLMPSTHAIP